MTNYPIDNLVVYDLEVYPGWFEAGFELPDGTTYQYVVASDDPNARRGLDGLTGFLSWVQSNGFTLAGFNSGGYDDAVLAHFLASGGDPMAAYAASVDLIHNDAPAWKYFKRDEDRRSVDLMPLLPGRLGLKKVGVCLGHWRLQELPVPWDQPPTPEQREVLLEYNKNDLAITRKLAEAVKGELALRAALSDQYGVDLRSKGDATMAEEILFAEYRAAGGAKSKKELNREAQALIGNDPRVWIFRPSWWSSLHPGRFPALETVIRAGEELFNQPLIVRNDYVNGKPIERVVFIGDRFYQMGVGGLHSVDGPGCWIPASDEILEDIDVESYYPNIALTQGIAPRPWGALFSKAYGDVVRRRLDAKHAGDKVTADSLKIAVNGTFGKTSNPYSSLYDPQMLANITVLGQLGLLALVAMLDGVGNVVSANTDGVTVLSKKANRETVRRIVEEWEQMTGLKMEFAEYRGLWQRDVNNYIALKTDGTTKEKGRFVCQWPDLRHTPSANIVATAIRDRIAKGVPLEETIRQCRDLNQFVLTQSVAKGWKTSWNGHELGRMLRFYKSTFEDAAPIIRTPPEGAKGKRGNVPDSDRCVPVEDLPGYFPPYLDFNWYILEAEQLFASIAIAKTPGMNRWAEAMFRAGLRPCYIRSGDRNYRAGVTYGDRDYTSRPPGAEWATGTGDGILAIVSTDADDPWTKLYRVPGPFPTKTRPLVERDNDFRLVYGAAVPLDVPCFHVQDAECPTQFYHYYTPAELKKAGTI